MRKLNLGLVRVAGSLALLSAAALAMTPSEAEACGGTFCDGGIPGPMPVDQTGENVIFVVGGAENEVHIQISYDPDTNAESFGWLVPLAEVPKFSVGSQPLFDQIRAASVPTYDIITTFEDCGGGFQTGGLTSDGDSLSGGDEGGASTSGADPGGPTVLLQETVGAFDVVVLTDTEVGPIKTWLLDNGYVWDENAAPILMEYLAEGNVIAALKLRRGTGPADVHPITLTYPSNETCFPLRLTRIAAVDDMDIRVFVLGNARAAPTNFKHVQVNPLKIDWINRGINYKEVISNAVDAFEAEGRAFVTEYAGTSSGVNTSAIYNPSWDETAFMGLDALDVVSTLNAQGLGACFDSFDCQWGHPLVFGLLLEHLPPPAGIEAAEFYAYLSQYSNDIDLATWGDGSGFAAGLLDRVIEPGIHGEELIQTWPYLTRLYTTISPNEMMEDPIFHINPDLEEVAKDRVAQNYVLCNNDSVVTLPDERQFYIPGGGPWPEIPGEEWFAEEVQTIALKGAPMTIVNHTSAIDKKLTEWNLSHGWPRGPGADTEGTPTTSDTATDSGNGGATEGTGSEGQTGDDEGCGCRSGDDSQGALWMGLSALGLLGLRRRRA